MGSDPNFSNFSAPNFSWLPAFAGLKDEPDMADEDHVKLMGINCLWIVQNINPFLAGLNCNNINDVNKVKSYRKEYIDLVNGCVNAGKENSISGYLTSLRWTTLNFRTAFWEWEKIEDSVDKIALTKPDDILC